MARVAQCLALDLQIDSNVPGSILFPNTSWSFLCKTSRIQGGNRFRLVAIHEFRSKGLILSFSIIAIISHYKDLISTVWFLKTKKKTNKMVTIPTSDCCIRTMKHQEK